MQYSKLIGRFGAVALATTSALALPAAARPTGQAAPAAAASTTATGDRTYASMMSNMQTMQAQMAQLRSTTDPRQRTRLLDEHMQMMQSTLRLMAVNRYGCPMGGAVQGRGMHGGGVMMGRGAIQGGAGGPSMMQLMMNQMLEHQQAMQGAGH